MCCVRCAVSLDPLGEILHRYWGYAEFRPLQREAIEAVIARRESLVVLPPGGGKALCFQLPALLDAPSGTQHVTHGTQHSAPGTAPSTEHPAPHHAPGTQHPALL